MFTWAAVTRPIVGSPSWTPPIVYDSLVMSVCGGSSTCRSVSRGVVIVARKRCIRAGRHLREGVAGWRRCWPPRPPPGFAPRAGASPGAGSWTPSFSRQERISACSAAVGGAIARLTSIRSPPVWISATIFGTFPSWWTACRVRPAETAATPSSPAISFACACGEGELRPRQEEVVDELRAGLAELGEIGDDGLVRLDDVAAAADRPNGPPASSAAVRVTVRSVPIPASGSSVALCASSSPFESPAIVITRPTPTASPSRVRIVRPRRRSSSARRYRR